MADKYSKPSARKRARDRAAAALTAERERATAIEQTLTALFISRDKTEPVIARAIQRRDDAITMAHTDYDRDTARSHAAHGKLLHRLRDLGLSMSELVDKTGFTLGEVRKLLRAPASDGESVDAPTDEPSYRDDAAASVGGTREPPDDSAGVSADAPASLVDREG